MTYDPNWGGIPNRRAGGGLPSDGHSRPPTQPVEAKGGFYSGLPFDKIGYYHRDVWITWPGDPPVGGQVTEIHGEVIPAGMVLLLTGIMYRGVVTLTNTSLPGAQPYTLLGDAHLFNYAFFETRADNDTFYDIRYNGPIAGAFTESGYPAMDLLNQDVLIPEVGFVLPVMEGSRLSSVIRQPFAAQPDLVPTYIGVQLRGMWMGRREYSSWQERVAR